MPTDNIIQNVAKFPEEYPYAPEHFVVKCCKHVAGLLSQTPGKPWHFVTGHAKTIQSPISRSYFDDITYVKVPPLWSTLINPSQLQHGLASISDKEISADGWSRCQANVTMPPDLLKPFDHCLLELQEKIPDGNASCAAFMNYAVRALQIMVCESDVFKHQLMWDDVGCQV